MLKLKDKNKKLIAGLINYKDLCIESILTTGDKKLSFSLPKEDKFYNFIEEECYIETKESEFVIKARDVGIDYTHFDCVLNLETLEANIFDRFESVEQTITNALNLAIVGTGWTVKANTLKKKRTVRCTNKNALEIVQEIKKTYRVDIVFNTLEKQIEIHEHLGEDKGTYFIDSLNLTALQVQSDSYQYATRIIAEGKDGLSFADINSGKNYVENYQYSRKVKTIYWKDERYTIKENLLEDARAKLEEISKPFTSYNASVLNLAELNPKYKSILDYSLGDTITLLSKSNKVRDKQRIVKTVEYPQDHSRDTVELANAILKFEDIQQENQETTDTVNNITTDNGTVDGSTIDSIQVKQIEDFKANVIEVVNLKAINASIDNLQANKADIQDLHAVNAKIGTLEGTKANITQLNAVSAEISKLDTLKANIVDLNSATAKIGVLEAKTTSIDNLLSQKASINDLNALNATISEALIKKATIAQLEALETKTNNLIADKANIKTLLNGNLSSENIQAGGITSDKLTIANGFITNLMISSVSASKITAGTIDAAKINVVNLNADNLTVGKINGQLLKDGSISGLAIENGAIDNNKVSPNANIEASKINISSVVTAINEGSTLLTANKVTIDSEKGTLDVAFNNLNTSLEANKKITESNSTAINVVQGKLSTSIENSKVLEGKQKTLEDNYNRTVVTVDSLKNTVGQQKTLIDSATGKITSVEVKANTLEKNLSGLTQTVSDTKKVIENNKTSLESKNAELKANIDSVSSSLSSVSSTVDKNNKTLVAKTNTLEQNLNGLTQRVESNKTVIDGKITSVEGETHELKAGLGGLTSKLDTLKSTTDGINKTVSNQGSIINQLKDSINLKVDSSTFTQSTTVINNNINRAKEEAINTANNAIDNLQISSRNLAINSNFNFGWRNWGFNNPNNNATVQIIKDSILGNCVKVTTQTSGQGVYSILKRKPKTTYSWGFMIKSDKPCKITVSHEYGEGTKEISLTTEWTKITGSGIWNGDGGALCFYSNGANPKITYYLTNLIYVEGDKVGDWTPAPDDLQAYAEEVAKAKADLAKTEAIANSDGKITEEERKRIQQAQENLNTAISKADKAKQDAILEANRVAELKKQEAINSANSHADSKANEALNNAKAFVNAEITTVNNKVHNVESNLNILSDRINTKVSQSDIDKAVTTIRTERIIYARGTGNDYPANSIVKVNGKTITDGQGRGLRINALNKATLERVFLQDYDTFGSEDAKVSFVNKINELNNGDFIIIITSQDASYPLHQPIKEALEKIGATLFDNRQGTYREAYALIGKSKLGRGNGVEMFIPRTANDKRFAEVSVKVGEDGTFIGVNPNNMGLEATLIKSNISDVSSSVTQLRDSVTTDIRAINSKTQSIETTLNGKASKQEVTEVNNRVATIKASLDGITQRVSATESKTQTLESNINGKASKQEVNNVSSKVVSLESNLSGITNRVSSTESRINALDGKVAGAVTIQQFTEFKQSNKDFQLKISQTTNLHNLVPNSTFKGGLREWICGGEFWNGSYTGYGFSGKICGAVKNKSTSEKFLTSYKAFKVEKNTTYTLNFHYKVEQNVQSMEAFVMLSNTESGDYGQIIKVTEALGGEKSDLTNDIPYSFTFNTGNFEWVWLRFDHNGMKPGTNWEEYCWLYISEIAVYKGNVGSVKYLPKGGENYDTTFLFDGMGFQGNFDDGSYAYLGKEGLEWYNAGTGHAYHALTYVTSFDIPIGNPGKAYIKLPAEFTKRRSSLKWTVALRGYYYSTDGDFFPFHIHCTGGRDYIENGLVVCEVQGYCKIQNSQNAGDVQFRPLTAMLIAIA